MNRIFALVFVLPLAGVVLQGCQGARMGISHESYGSVDGQSVELYTLRNASGMEARITNYGAIVTELRVKDRHGRYDDIVLGFDSLDEYVDHNPYFGCMAGRCANRIANARFELDGVNHELNANNGQHHLHGGLKGLDKVVWSAEEMEGETAPPSIDLSVSGW